MTVPAATQALHCDHHVSSTPPPAHDRGTRMIYADSHRSASLPRIRFHLLLREFLNGIFSAPPPLRSDGHRARWRANEAEVRASEVDEFLVSVLTHPVRTSVPTHPTSSDSLEDYKDSPDLDSVAPSQPEFGSRNTQALRDCRVYDNKPQLYPRDLVKTAPHADPLGSHASNRWNTPSMRYHASSSRNVDSRSGEIHKSALNSYLPNSSLRNLDGSSKRSLVRNAETVKMVDPDSMELDPVGQETGNTFGFWDHIATRMSDALDGMSSGLPWQTDIKHSPSGLNFSQQSAQHFQPEPMGFENNWKRHCEFGY